MDGLQQIWEVVRWAGALLLGMGAWIYAQDRQEVRGALKSHTARDDEQDRRISMLESSRPGREELTAAVTSLRQELRADVARLHEDVTALNRDINVRLDAVISKLTK